MTDNKDNSDKVKIELERNIVNELIKRKRVGDTYSDVVKKLLEREKIEINI